MDRKIIIMGSAAYGIGAKIAQIALEHRAVIIAERVNHLEEQMKHPRIMTLTPHTIFPEPIKINTKPEKNFFSNMSRRERKRLISKSKK